jgi:hypothetical protein
MADTTQTTDLDLTIHLLQQDLSTVDTALAIMTIERWEEHLQGTDIFKDLSELKQALLNGRNDDVQSLLRALSEKTNLMADSLSGEPAEQTKQIAALLVQGLPDLP